MSELVLPHVVFARQVLDEAPPGLPYPFVRRCQIAALPSVPQENTIEAPTYLMDMGLRRWRDPQVLFKGTLGKQPGLKKAWGPLAAEQDEALVLQARAW